MMNKKRTRTAGRIKYALFAPLAAALLLVSNIEAVARTVEKVMDASEATNTVPQDKPKEDQIFQICEVPPQFPGGMVECMKFLGSNIKYPAEAVAKKQEGRVVVQMVIEKDGSITNTKVVRSVSPLLDQEALRVVSMMPKWIPGKQRGQAVRVQYTLPIVFELNGNNEEMQHHQAKLLPDNNEVFMVVEEAPSYPGGMAECMKFLGSNIKYPAEAVAKKQEGRVVIQMVIEKDGSITDTKVVRSVSPLLDEEALRVVGMMPKWNPGKQRGQAVRVQYTLPVMFSLNGEIDEIQEHQVKMMPDENGIYNIVEEPASFPGGMANCLKFLSENMKYPEDCKKEGIQGRVIAQFLIDKDGSIKDVKIVRGVHPSLDKESIRVIESMPRWTPGKVKGEPVKTKFTLPVAFKI